VRPSVYWPLSIAATALVALLSYGVVSSGPDTTIDDRIAAGERVEAPVSDLRRLGEDGTGTLAEHKGKVVVLNVWASWCISCRDEHPLLIEYAKSGAVPIYGLNWKDKPEDALAWLGELGDPYVLSAADLDGRVAIDYGVYGAPETYLIDQGGVIRYKHIGPITRGIWKDNFLPLVEQLNRQGASR
jgi:cytochrome c biogenesis protein CcmG/thiol:disulfide interchange protein DsbE